MPPGLEWVFCDSSDAIVYMYIISVYIFIWTTLTRRPIPAAATGKLLILAEFQWPLHWSTAAGPLNPAGPLPRLLNPSLSASQGCHVRRRFVPDASAPTARAPLETSSS